MSDVNNNQPQDLQNDGELSDSELNDVAGGVAPAPGTQQILIGLLLPAVQPPASSTPVLGDGSVKAASLNFNK